MTNINNIANYPYYTLINFLKIWIKTLLKIFV